MSSSLAVRPARVEDVAQMARVNVRCWQETYRGLMFWHSAEMRGALGDPEFTVNDDTLVVAQTRFRD